LPKNENFGFLGKNHKIELRTKNAEFLELL
jgi:hypothetical protein